MAAAIDNQPGFTPLDQLGQGYYGLGGTQNFNYTGQPNPNPPQTGFSPTSMSPFLLNAFPRISQNPAFSSLFQTRGGPQNSNYADAVPAYDAASHPPNPPA